MPFTIIKFVSFCFCNHFLFQTIHPHDHGALEKTCMYSLISVERSRSNEKDKVTKKPESTVIF